MEPWSHLGSGTAQKQGIALPATGMIFPGSLSTHYSGGGSRHTSAGSMASTAPLDHLAQHGPGLSHSRQDQLLLTGSDTVTSRHHEDEEGQNGLPGVSTWSKTNTETTSRRNCYCHTGNCHRAPRLRKDLPCQCTGTSPELAARQPSGHPARRLQSITVSSTSERSTL